MITLDKETTLSINYGAGILELELKDGGLGALICLDPDGVESLVEELQEFLASEGRL